MHASRSAKLTGAVHSVVESATSLQNIFTLQALAVCQDCSGARQLGAVVQNNLMVLIPVYTRSCKHSLMYIYRASVS